MKALFLNSDKSLEIKEVVVPQLHEQDVLVSLKASALNHREIWIKKGLYPGMKLPCILGADGAGVITKIGSKVDASILGKEVIVYPGYDWGEKETYPSKSFRVLGMPDPGTIAEYISVPFDHVIEKPSYLNFPEAASIPVAFLTAWRALVHHGQIDESKNILITGIGGGVAQAGLALAKAFGSKIFVTSSSQEKIDFAKKQGALAGVNYKKEDWHLELREQCKEIDIVLDSSPSPKLDDYYSFLRYGAKIVAYGSTGSRNTSINISKFFLRHIQFIGTAMGSPKEFEELLAFMDQHHIRPIIHAQYSMNQSLTAIEELQKGNHIGKIVIGH